MTASRGLLLVNVGTPEGAGTAPQGRVLPPGSAEVGAYLSEFLMDPRVVDLPWLARWLLVHGIILRMRPAASSALYAKIWTERGSPLLVNTQEFAAKLRARLGDSWAVAVGMRYGKPSIEAALRELLDAGASELVSLPLFPQSAEATTGSVMASVLEAHSRLCPRLPLRHLGPFYDDEGFLAAFAERIRASLDLPGAGFDALVFSFHGLPERHIRKRAHDSSRCLTEECCGRMHEQNQHCYRAQCFETARLLAGECSLSDNFWHVSFQSRLGRSRWIGPSTEEVLLRLAKGGTKRVLVACPAFVADCLETLEEIGMRARDAFLGTGGERFELVPSLNSLDRWVDAVSGIVNAKR